MAKDKTQKTTKPQGGAVQETTGSKTSKIIQSIKSEADYKIRVMEDVLSNKLSTLNEENDKVITVETGIINKELERNKAILDNRIIAEAELSARRKIEDAREEVVSKVFRDARLLMRKEVETASSAYMAFLKRRGEEAKRLIPSGGTAEVVSGDKAASTLSAMGFQVLETLSPSVIGGALFHAPNGEMHLDSTLAHLIQRDMVELRTMASEALFAGAKPTPSIEPAAPAPGPEPKPPQEAPAQAASPENPSSDPRVVDAIGGSEEEKEE